MNNKKIYKIFNSLLNFFEDIRIEYVDQYNKNISNYIYIVKENFLEYVVKRRKNGDKRIRR